MTDTLTHEAICDDPTDPLPRAAMRDYWEERGDGLRVEAWMALNGCRPSKEKTWDDDEYLWWWYSDVRSNRPGSVLSCREWSICIIDDSTHPHVPSGVTYFNSHDRAFIGAVEGYVRWKTGETK